MLSNDFAGKFLTMESDYGLKAVDSGTVSVPQQSQQKVMKPESCNISEKARILILLRQSIKDSIYLMHIIGGPAEQLPHIPLSGRWLQPQLQQEIQPAAPHNKCSWQ